MDTELNIQNLLLIIRAMEEYRKHLYVQIENLQDTYEELDEESKEYEKMGDDIANLVDEADKTSNVLRRVEEIYAFRHEQQYGEKPLPVREV